MASVESVVVWSSASTFTQAPTASAAAWQIRRALASAMSCPTVGQELPERRQLQRDLERRDAVAGRRVQPAERLEQVEVGLHGRLGLGRVAGVLAQVVDADRPARGEDVAGRGDDRVLALARHVAPHDHPADRQAGDDALQPGRPAGGQEQRPQRVRQDRQQGAEPGQAPLDGSSLGRSSSPRQDSWLLVRVQRAARRDERLLHGAGGGPAEQVLRASRPCRSCRRPGRRRTAAGRRRRRSACR